MADNNPNILGTTTENSNGSALEIVQAEQIRRLEQEKEQAEAAAPPASVPVPPAMPRSRFDADAANARAASRPFADFRTAESGSGSTFSAAGTLYEGDRYAAPVSAAEVFGPPNPANIPNYQEVRPAQPSPDDWQPGNPASDPRVAPSYAYAKPSRPLYNSYEEASQAKSDILTDARNLYVSQGNYASIGSKAFNAQLEEAYVSAGLANPTVQEPVGAYQAYQNRVRGITTATQNEYAEMGMADMVGTPVYQDLVNRRLKDGGTINGQEFEGGLIDDDEYTRRSNQAFGVKGGEGGFKEWIGSTEAAWSLGFGGMQTASNLTKALNPLVSGESYLPDQVAEQSFTSGLPLVGSILGAIGGARLGPGGAMTGQFLGQSVGGGAEGLVDQYFTGHNFAQERASQSLGEGRGGADAVREFADALKSAATPAAKDLADAMTRLGQTGPLSPGAAGQFAQFQQPMGTAFAANVASEGRFLESSGFLAPIRATFGSSPMTGLTANDFTGNAAAAAMSGDYDAMRVSLAFEEVKAGKDTLNPDYARDKGVVDRYESKGPAGKWWQHLKDEWTGDDGQSGAYYNAQDRLKNEPQYLTRQDAVKAQQAATDAASVEQMYETHQIDTANIGYGASLVGRDTTLLKNSMIAGGGSATIGAAIPGLTSDVRVSTDALNSDIAANQANASKFPLQKAFFDAQTADDQQKLAALSGVIPGANRAKFDTGLEEHESAFGLDITQRHQGFTRGLLSGRTYDQLSSDEYGILSSETARANQVRRDAYNPFVSPADRDKMLAQAAGMDTSVLAERHDFQQNVYRQTNAGLDLAISGASEQAGEARAFGTPDAVYGAQSHELDALKSKYAELTSEMSRSGLTADEVRQKEAELVSVRGQAVQVTAQQRDERIANSRGMAEDDLTIATAGMGHLTRSQGSAGIDVSGIDSTFGGILNADQDAIAQYAPGTRDRKDAEAKLSTDQARFQETQDALNQYTPSASTRIGDIQGAGALRRAETGFEMEQISPYRSGDPSSSPFTAALGLEKSLRADIALQGRDQASEDAERTRKMKAGIWDDVAQASYLADTEQRTQATDRDRLRFATVEHNRQWELLRAVPEMIAGEGATGNSVKTFSFDALSAAFSPNVLQGSWGHAAMPRGASLPGSSPGSAFDGFQQYGSAHTEYGAAHPAISPQAASAASSTATLSGAIQNLAHGLNNQQVVALLQQINQTLQRMNAPAISGQNGPPRSFGSSALQNQRQGFNSNRPSQK